MFKNYFELYENIKSLDNISKNIVKNNYQNELQYSIQFLYLMSKHKDLFDIRFSSIREYCKNTFYLYEWGFNPVNRINDIFNNRQIIDKLPEELLELYSFFYSWQVRNAIAGCSNTPIEVLHKLSEDHDSYVAHKAIVSLTDRNQ